MTKGIENPPAISISLRDYFAGVALQAIIAKHIEKKSDGGLGAAHPDRALAAGGAYAYADAMLKERQS